MKSSYSLNILEYKAVVKKLKENIYISMDRIVVYKN